MEAIIVKNYKEVHKPHPPRKYIQSIPRHIAIFLLSAFSKMDSSKEWIRFPFYHHVSNDEKSGFERHLRFFKNYGDFISIDSAVDIFQKKRKINGRYFCITFDDGFKNCVSNALPILVENKCPATFFIATNYIGCETDRPRNFFSALTDASPLYIEFLNWDDCRKLLKAGMTIGSHTCSHIRLSELNKEELKAELLESKKKIEKELGIVCYHFCCPFGVPGKHFRVGIDPIVAKEMGYRSFLTTEPGPNFNGTDPFRIRRDWMLAEWRSYQLRYYFAKKVPVNA